MLKAMVDSGTLPPLAERLPEKPMVVTPLREVGKYGGDLDSAIVGGGSLSMLFRYQAYEPLVRYNPEWTSVIPNVAEAFEANDTATEFTFTLRKGMKWSDGQPYTTDDVMFWYEDVFMNPDVEVTNQDHLISGDDKAVFTKIDDQNVQGHRSSPRTACSCCCSPGPIATRRRASRSTTSASSMPSTTPTPTSSRPRSRHVGLGAAVPEEVRRCAGGRLLPELARSRSCIRGR